MHFTAQLHYELLSLAPLVQLSPEVVEIKSLKANWLTCATTDPALQECCQRKTELCYKRKSDYEMEVIKEKLVIEPTHPSNTGTYYCATAEDVARLIVKNQGDCFLNKCTLCFSYRLLTL